MYNTTCHSDPPVLIARASFQSPIDCDLEKHALASIMLNKLDPDLLFDIARESIAEFGAVGASAVRKATQSVWSFLPRSTYQKMLKEGIRRGHDAIKNEQYSLAATCFLTVARLDKDFPDYPHATAAYVTD